MVTVRLADRRELRREAHAGSSFQSSEDPRLHFGLGREDRIDDVRVAWPDGGTTARGPVPANQVLTVSQEEN